MSLIKNLIKEPETKSKSKKDSENSSDDEKKVRPVIKSAIDLQRLKLEKLMKNPVMCYFINLNFAKVFFINE